MFIPWMILAAGSAVLAALYPSFPDRFATHYNALGQPDAWSEKSPAVVFLPIFIGIFVAAVFEVVGRIARPRVEQPWADRLAQLQLEVLRGVSAVMALFLVTVACSLPLAKNVDFVLGPLALTLLSAVAYPVYRFRSFAREMERAGALPAGYRGLTYNNPDDPRIWVPKLTGNGYTINFAHRKAWLYMALLLALPVLILGLAGFVAALAK